jgi:hypothetical protein
MIGGDGPASTGGVVGMRLWWVRRGISAKRMSVRVRRKIQTILVIAPVWKSRANFGVSGTARPPDRRRPLTGRACKSGRQGLLRGNGIGQHESENNCKNAQQRQRDQPEIPTCQTGRLDRGTKKAHGEGFRCAPPRLA